MAAQRRNIEALSQANQLAVEGVQAVARRQIEIARQALEDVSALMRDFVQPVSAEDRIAKNTEYAKQMLEKSISHGREITQLAAKAGSEAAEILHKRACEGLDELREFASTRSRTDPADRAPKGELVRAALLSRSACNAAANSSAPAISAPSSTANDCRYDDQRGR